MITIKENLKSNDWGAGDTFISESEVYLIGYGSDALYRAISMSGNVSQGYDTIEALVDNWIDPTDAKVDLECTIKY